MKIIDNQVIEYHQKPGLAGVFEAIRDAAAICYQTDVDKMKLSPKDFVERVLLPKGHIRPLEFGTVYLTIDETDSDYNNIASEIVLYQRNPYSKVNYDSVHHVWYITTNYCVIMMGTYGNNIKEALLHNYDCSFKHHLNWMTEPTQYHYQRQTFNIICSRGCSDDLRTHITLSSICESTRFCNYSQDKFGGELTFIRPYWIPQDVDIEPIIHKLNYTETPNSFKLNENEYILYLYRLSEQNYINIAQFQPAQVAKRVYPLGAKVELRLCGFEDAWNTFIWRRTDAHADPECQIVANQIKELLNN